MSDIKQLKETLQSLTSQYENGELSKEEYLELVKDIDTSKLVAKTAEEVEDLAAMNGVLNGVIAGISLVA